MFKIPDDFVIGILENIDINKSTNIDYGFLKFNIKNNYGQPEIRFKGNFILKVLIFFILSFLSSIIGVILVSLLTKGDQRLIALGYIPILIILFLTNSITHYISKIIFKKDYNNFENLLVKAKFKTIDNTIKSSNTYFIKRLDDLNKISKLSNSLLSEYKAIYLQDLQMKRINEEEYNYLLLKINNI